MTEEVSSLEPLTFPMGLNSGNSGGNTVHQMPVLGPDSDCLSTDSAFCDQQSVSDCSNMLGLTLKRLISLDSSHLTTPTSADSSPCVNINSGGACPQTKSNFNGSSLFSLGLTSNAYTSPDVFPGITSSSISSSTGNDDFRVPPPSTFATGENSMNMFGSGFDTDFLGGDGVPNLFLANYSHLLSSTENSIYDPIYGQGDAKLMFNSKPGVHESSLWPDPFSMDAGAMCPPLGNGGVYQKRPITRGNKNFRPSVPPGFSNSPRQAPFASSKFLANSSTGSMPLATSNGGGGMSQAPPQSNVWMQAVANQKLGLAPSPMNGASCPPPCGMPLGPAYLSQRVGQQPPMHGLPDSNKARSMGRGGFLPQQRPLLQQAKMNSDMSPFPFNGREDPSSVFRMNGPDMRGDLNPSSMAMLEDTLGGMGQQQPTPFDNTFNATMLPPMRGNNTISPLNSLRAQLEAPLIDALKSSFTAVGHPRTDKNGVEDALLMGLNSVDFSCFIGGSRNVGPGTSGDFMVEEKYSRKVFVGGLPPDIDEEEITTAFRRFGSLVVDWPHKAESKSFFPPKGYCFLLFQEEIAVQNLIDSCIVDDGKYYWCVSSPTFKSKMVQLRPWCLSDSDYVMDDSQPLDPRRTIFVGGVPRPLTAFELAKIVDQLYGGVCYAGIDTDPELKYPKGAGRVSFSNQQSYIAAISARFVQLQHKDIDKRVEVKPYVLDDQMCDECGGMRCGGKYAPFFCANVSCLQYYCEHCWAQIHNRQGREFHKPLVKEGADRPRSVPFRW